MESVLLTDLSVHVWLSSALWPHRTSAARLCHNRQVVRGRERRCGRTLRFVCVQFLLVHMCFSMCLSIAIISMWSFSDNLHIYYNHWSFVPTMIMISVIDTVMFI